MKAELNEKNEVVVTMIRGEAQRVANAAWNYDTQTTAQRRDCDQFAEEVSNIGIEFIFD